MIVVYDVTNGESFVNVKRWLQEIDQNCDVVNRILGESTISIPRNNYCNDLVILCLFVVEISVAEYAVD